MGILIDGSTPAAVDSAGNTSLTAVTASFSPPSGSLALVTVNIGLVGSSAMTVSVADSLSNSYTAGPSEYAFSANGVWYFAFYYTSAPGAITVTATRSSASAGLFSLVALVLTGANSNQSGAAAPAGVNNGSTTMESAITPTQVGSWCFASTVSNSAAGTADGLTDDHNVHDSTDGVLSTLGHAVTSTLTAETIGWLSGASAFWAWAAWEILPAPTGSPYTGTNGKLASPAQPGVAQVGAFIPGQPQAQPAAVTATAGVATVGAVAAGPGNANTAPASVAAAAAAVTGPSAASTASPPAAVISTAANSPAVTTAGNVTANAQVAAVGAVAVTPVAQAAALAAPASVAAAGNATSSAHGAGTVAALVAAVANGPAVSTVPTVNAPAGVATVGAVAPAPGPSSTASASVASSAASAAPPALSVTVAAPVAVIGVVSAPATGQPGRTATAGVAAVAASVTRPLAGAGAAPAAASVASGVPSATRQVSFSAAVAVTSAVAASAFIPVFAAPSGLAAARPRAQWSAGAVHGNGTGTGGPHGYWSAQAGHD